MVIIRLLIFFVAMALLSNLLGPAYSQMQQNGEGQSSLKWISHQMNQSDQNIRPRGSISPKMIDEIRKLYLLAKKELEKQGSQQKPQLMPAKAATSHGQSKQMVNPAKVQLKK